MAKFLGLFGDRPESVDAAVSLLATAEERFKAVEGERDKAIAEREAVAAERDKLRLDLVKARDALKGERAKVRAFKSDTPARPRKIGPIEQQPNAADLLELIAAADLVEVALSDGTREIAGMARVAVAGGIDAWTPGVAGLMLTAPEVLVDGPERRKSAVKLCGYGLLLDGELVAYRERYEPLELPPGQSRNLAGDIVF